MTTGKVLIVEDQPAVAKALAVLLELHDVECVSAPGPDQALALLDLEPIDVVVQDMNFSPGATGGEEGLALFHRLRERDPGLPVIAMTAWTSLEAAVQMVKAGATDYLGKPWDDARLVDTVVSLLAGRAARRAALDDGPVGGQRARLEADHDLCGLLYASPAMHRVVRLALQVAPADVPVLITGPNGAGKEKLAEIIQANSRRRAKPFVRVDVGALPEELLEAELFGAEAGAYTGAHKLRIGRFETADGGTLFLDEMGNLSMTGQTKLLRVLETGEFERLGSSHTRQVDVRVVAATNVDLRRAIEAGRFREDLYFRLNVIELAVPALRERGEDVVLLAEGFLRRFAAGAGRSFSGAARAALRAHDWPGNVREVANRVQRAVLVADHAVLGPADLDLEAAAGRRATPTASDPGAGTAPGSAEPGGAPADATDRARIQQILAEQGGSVSRAAARLGISRQALYRRMEKLGIVIERRPR